MCQKQQTQLVQSLLSCSTAFFNSLARSRYLSFFSFKFFQFYSVVSRDSKVDNFANSFSFFFFLLIIIRSGLLAEIRWSVCMTKSHRSLCVIFQDRCWDVHIPFVSMVKFKFLAHFPGIILPTQSCLVLYSLCANLLHSLIMWLMVSSLSPHSLHLLFCWVLSILALIWLVLIALFCAAIRRDSFSLLRFPFLSQVQVLSCEKLFISRFVT